MSLLPPPPPEPGGFLWLRQLHWRDRGQRADELPFQPGDGDDPRGLHDVGGGGLPHDDPALPPSHQHHAFRTAGRIEVDSPADSPFTQCAPDLRWLLNGSLPNQTDCKLKNGGKKGRQDVTWPLFRQTVSYVLIVMASGNYFHGRLDFGPKNEKQPATFKCPPLKSLIVLLTGIKHKHRLFSSMCMLVQEMTSLHTLIYRHRRTHLTRHLKSNQKYVIIIIKWKKWTNTESNIRYRHGRYFFHQNWGTVETDDICPQINTVC